MKIKLDEGAVLPTRAHKDDAGLDIYAPLNMKPKTIRRHGSLIIHTGVHVEVPEDYAGLVESKSGLNIKHDLISLGLIDTGYTGSVVVKLYNLGRKRYKVRPGDKISQLVIAKILRPVPQIVDELEATERGDNGFGSTGSNVNDSPCCGTCKYFEDFTCMHPYWQDCRFGSLWWGKDERKCDQAFQDKIREGRNE